MESQLAGCSAAELAGLIARGEVSALEVVDAHIARIEQVNPRLNAVVVRRYDEARAEAQQADRRRRRGAPLGPLHGVPVTVKECLDLVGTPSTFGVRRRAQDLPLRDDPYVARLRAAGAVVVGKTNVPQLLLYYESDNPLYGRTSNPWSAERSAGGSGGEGAVIAAGGSPLGLGTDIGGSLRIPAAFCGIASIKPTAPRTLDFARFTEVPAHGAVVSLCGPMARDVADVALGLELISEVPNAHCPQPRPLEDYRAVDLRGLRVACYTDDGTLSPSPAVRRAVREAAAALRDCGAQVLDWQPPQVPEALVLFLRLISGDTLPLLRQMIGRERLMPQLAQLVLLSKRSRASLALLERTLRRVGQPSMARALPAFGHRGPAARSQGIAAFENYRQRFAEVLDAGEAGPFDLILCPACALPAFTHGASTNLVTAGAYAPLYNLLGYPAGVVPVTRVRPGEEIGRPASLDLVERTARQVEQGSAGLPVGVQVVARPWQEHLALAAMQAIQDSVRAAEPARFELVSA